MAETAKSGGFEDDVAEVSCYTLQCIAAQGPPTLKIASKGLILVLTPLAFEVVFVGVLGFMLNQSESRIVQENRARTVVSDLIRLREVVAEVSNEQSIQALQPKEQFDQVTANRLTPFRSAERNSQYAFTSLKAGLKDDTNALEELNQLERMFSQWLLMQRQAMIYDNEGNTGLYKEAMLKAS